MLRKSITQLMIVMMGMTISSTVPVYAAILQEVVVTAQKREQSLQDVGVAVTAFSGDQLRALGLNNSIDLVAQTPGLEANGFGGGAISTFSIRGVGQNDFSANQEAPIAVYVDEAYIRSEERRVGKECRSRGAPDDRKKKRTR